MTHILACLKHQISFMEKVEIEIELDVAALALAQSPAPQTQQMAAAAVVVGAVAEVRTLILDNSF